MVEFWLNLCQIRPPAADNLNDKSIVSEKAAQIYPDLSLAELGEIVNGVKPKRQSDSEITFFKSVGVAVQDASAAGCILRQAEERKLGKIIDI